MGKWSNIWGKFSGGNFTRGGKFGGWIYKKNENLQISIQKWIYVLRSFIKIRKWSNLGGKCSGGNFTGGGILNKNEDLQNAVAKLAYTQNFAQIGQLESGQISSKTKHFKN